MPRWTRRGSVATLFLFTAAILIRREDSDGDAAFLTAGESHGQALLAFVSGLPACLPISLDFVNRELHRRQLGFGRGGRQRIEKDRAEIFAGVRHGKTIGAPIAIRIENRDWKNWEKSAAGGGCRSRSGTSAADLERLTAPRPGHADLAGRAEI